MSNNMEMKMQCGALIKHFEETVRDVYHEIARNRAERSATLAADDLLLLRSTESAIRYVSSIYENQWKICLTEVTKSYLEKVETILMRTMGQMDRDYKGTENYLSILDVKALYDCTQDFIYFLVAEFDPEKYQLRRSPIRFLMKYLPGPKKSRTAGMIEKPASVEPQYIFTASEIK